MLADRDVFRDVFDTSLVALEWGFNFRFVNTEDSGGYYSGGVWGRVGLGIICPCLSLAARPILSFELIVYVVFGLINHPFLR